MTLKVQDYYHYFLPEDESGYTALHLMNNVNRYQKKYKREIILVASLGSTENIYISNRLISISNKLINEIRNTYSFFNERLYFYDLDLKNENDIICYLCHQLNKLGYCIKNYVNKVLKKEILAPTTYGNLFAIPHPIEKVAYENKIAIAILKDNVQWQDKKVKLVLLFSLSPNKDKSIEDFFEKLIVLLNDINIV